jgi:membrane-associated phospholipid phosphatase
MEIIRRFDETAGQRILSLPGRWRPLFAGVSLLGEPWAVLAISLCGFISAMARGEKPVERAFFLAAIAYGVNTAIKLLLHRRRPYNLKVSTLGITSYSFPSGHAFGTIIFYGLFSYLDYRYLIRPWNIIIALLIWAMVFLIGTSRVFLKFHYPSDVAAGWLLGLLSLWLVTSLSF